jgi:hypothetical protein
MALLPTGPGAARTLAKGNLAYYWAQAVWTPDSRSVIFYASEAKRGPRLIVQPIDGAPRAVGPEGLLAGLALSPDARQIATNVDGKGYLIDVVSGATKPFPAIDGRRAMAWAADGRSLLTYTTDIAMTVSKLDLATGRESAWKTFMPADRAGVVAILGARITPDERSYAYTYARRLSELYVISGLK